MLKKEEFDPVLQRIAQAVRSIRFGTVQIVIHDAKVVQIEKTEKFRWDLANQTAGGHLKHTVPTDQTTGGGPF